MAEAAAKGARSEPDVAVRLVAASDADGNECWRPTANLRHAGNLAASPAR